ncbi:hypothetical protein PoB_001025200 [Plakobranchus ocellatus]|uniref:Uncharacterized protein n=1 Tax=Plakobranchus ocellatus TaxID=259542 RepID=A0AAV3YLE3_9GAST|nr:hypothetical protein PoB_001025200 [Plakobranchus ocellatus]
MANYLRMPYVRIPSLVSSMLETSLGSILLRAAEPFLEGREEVTVFEEHWTAVSYFDGILLEGEKQRAGDETHLGNAIK